MSAATITPTTEERIRELLQLFKLPTVAEQLCQRLVQAGQEDAIDTVLEVLEAEQEERQQRRWARLLKASRLPPGKTFDQLQPSTIPRKVMQSLRLLETGEFLNRAENVLCFGLPGRGKTHAACALGHALVQRGFSVLFVPTYRLVQELLAAKRDLELPRALRKLDSFDLLILDDIGYVQQSAEEVEVLFTLLAERYERRSLLVTSNLVFGEWGQIFKNPMTTAAAIDRLVHHAVILEFTGESERANAAAKRRKKEINSDET